LVNDADATVGVSIAPDDGLFPTTIPTLWEPGENGGMQAIDLRNEIPDKPAYRLDWAHVSCLSRNWSFPSRALA
jgi:hypothetical protein